MKIVEVTSKHVLFSNGKVLTYQHYKDDGSFCCDEGGPDFLVLKSFKHLGRDENRTVFDVEIDTIEVLEDFSLIRMTYYDNRVRSEFVLPILKCPGRTKILLIYQNGVREAVWDC